MMAHRVLGYDNLSRLPKFEKPKVGEVWVEMDPRRALETRLVEIVGEFSIETGKVAIKHLSTQRIHHAKLTRFNGHMGGYAPKVWFDQSTPNTMRDVPHRIFRRPA